MKTLMFMHHIPWLGLLAVKVACLTFLPPYGEFIAILSTKSAKVFTTSFP